jgi:16S rRNA (adenine1518-N6/adenine1519-N6)-dimethyltransferase
MKELFKPTQLKELCQEYGLSPSKRYGQNYLISKGIVQKIIDAAELKKTDTIVEIGPGFGVLTCAMAPHVRRVVAFEIEKKLQSYWEEKQKEYPNVEIIWGNALKELKAQSSKLKGNYKIIANLPYQITSHALRVVLEAESKPERMIVMVQKEVAERIVARPGKMSLLSVSVQYFGEPRLVAKVSKGNFWPAPKVDSAVLSIDVYKTKGTRADERFFQTVRAGFQNKRKQLWRNISRGLGIPGDAVKAVVADVALDSAVRAEALSVEQWKDISKRLA